MTERKTNGLHDRQMEKENIHQSNLDAMAVYRPDLFRQVGNRREREHGEVSTIAREEPWPGMYDHLNTVSPQARGLVVFLGMGLGHAALLLHQERSDVAQIVILEPSLSLFQAAMESVDLCPLISSKRVHFFVGEFDWNELETAVTRVASLEDTHILRHLPSFRLLPGLYGPLNDRAYMMLNQINASGSTSRICGNLFLENRFSIFTLLRHAYSLDAIRDKFRDLPAVLVAAGPSLTQSLPGLRRLAGRCVLIAADSALAPLLQAGIIPDFVTSIDYLDLNFEKLAPFLDGNWPFSLVTLVKSTPLVPKRFPAANVFLAFSEDQPQEWMVRALGIKTLAAAASSVAHLSLGLALVLGCEPIIFTGQDLSYTNSVGDHAQGTIIMRDDPPKDREMFRRPAVGGGSVTTDRQLLSLLKLFEDIIAAAPRRYINATAAGVRITGTTEMTLDQVEKIWCQSPVSVAESVGKAIDSSPAFDMDNFTRTGRKNLDAVRETREKLTEVIALTERIYAEMDRLPARTRRNGRFAVLPPRLQKQLALFDRMNGDIDNAEATWTQVLEQTFAMLGDSDQRLRDNTRLREEAGYMAWLAAELDRINSLNIARRQVLESYAGHLERLLGHLDEEKSLLAQAGAAAARELLTLHLAAGNYVLVRRMLECLPEFRRDDALFCFLRGEAKAGMLDFPGALADWREALRLDSSLKERVGAVKQRCMEDWLGFVERYGNAEEGGDNFPHLLPVWLGRLASLLADDRNLPERFLAVWQIHRGRIEKWLDENRLPPAELTLNGWRIFGDRLPEIEVLRSKLFAARGEYDAAIKILREILAGKPGHPAWQALLTRQLLQAGRFDEAVSSLVKAVELDNGNAVIWEEIGDMLFAGGDYDSAALAYEKCFLFLPGRLDSLCKMGNCYLSRGQTEAAIAAFAAVLRRDPLHESARLAHGKALAV